jgi:hypothetical protein
VTLRFRDRPVEVFDVLKVCAYAASAVLGIAAVYLFSRWPIVAGDTDVWYHLNGGRYIWTHGAIPTDSAFFSFMAPPRPWLDYYWLFQVLVFKIYSLAEYPGLIVLRAAVYGATISMIAWLLVRRQPRDEARLYGLIIFGLYVAFLIPRYTLVRPHMFSYALLVAFLLILEQRGKATLLLPLLGVLWVNLHGGAYPVMTLITFAYLVEMGVGWLRDRASMTRAAILGAVPIMVAMNTIYLTPHGLALLEVPFTQLGPASRYINEFRPVQINDLLTFSFSADILALTYGTLFNLMLVAASAAVLASLWRRSPRVSHLLLIAGGAFLLAKGARFKYEFALLALPVIAANPLIPARAMLTRTSRSIVALVAVACVAMSISAVSHWFKHRPKYPMSPANLPVGAVTFLNRIGTGGRLLNQPNAGGYLQWMLYPRYKIFMDMEVPFLFTDEDMVLASTMFANRQVLTRVLERYRPDYIMVGVGQLQFKPLVAAFPEYRAVFVDDTDVLYVNATSHPEVARGSALGDIDPFSLPGLNVERLARERATLEPVLRRLVAIHPTGAMTHHMLGALAREDGAFHEALSHAAILIENYPEWVAGYRLRAEALAGEKRFHDSIASYREALARAGGQAKPAIQIELAKAYKELGHFEKAYGLLRDAMNVFDPATSYKTIWEFADSALKAGRIREAALLLRLGATKVPPDDKEWEEKYRRAHAALGERGAADR